MNTVEVGGARQITLMYVRSVWFVVDVAVVVAGLVVDAHGVDQGVHNPYLPASAPLSDAYECAWVPLRVPSIPRPPAPGVENGVRA
jgi:hypothetical protein